MEDLRVVFLRIIVRSRVAGQAGMPVLRASLEKTLNAVLSSEEEI
jgi:hypothetical protein